MRLTAIEMQGFKSFPDKTRITFDSGVTAIIGPNGSGKSNISDAMRWVLGEMSVKSLRGSRMEDVIFNGTPNRPAANCASVSLTINTEEEYNLAHTATLEGLEGESAEADPKKPRLSDNPEVTVTRKYYRSGESEYYINKKQVRLKDVYELFYDTGIGREGYSVIGQGKISEVLSQKDEERRSIFEEAAGISKFRYKKLEAERKLRDTEQNLVRVNDILSEISSRIGPLEKEAENARQYLVLSEEKKSIEITLWLDRIDFLRQRRTECEAELFRARQELSEAEAEVEKCDSATDKMMDESYEFSRSMSETEREKSDTIHKKGDLEARRAVCENDVLHAKQTVEENEALIIGCGSEILIAEESVKNEESSLGASRDALLSAEDRCRSAENDFENARQSCASAANASETAGMIVEKLSASKATATASLAAAEASFEALKKSARENSERIAQGRERITRLEEERNALDKKIASLEQELLQNASSSEELSKKLQESTEKEKELREQITAQKVELSKSEQRRESLVRMEQLLEGYSDSVKHIINDSAEGRIIGNGKKVSVCGTVSNIISSDSEYVVALETALAASVQFVVVEKESDAKACIAYLKENKLGRATFLPIESVEGRVCDTAPYKSMKGYVGLASELAKYDPRFKGVVNDLLGRTLIADGIDNASAIARKSDFRIKLVTLDGQVINPGGSYTGGSSAKKVGVFTRAMDIERLGEEIEKGNELLKNTESEADKLSEEAKITKTRLNELENDSNGLRDVISRLTASVGTLEARMEEENSHIEAISGVDAEAELLEQRIGLLREELSKCEESESLAASARTARREEYEQARLEEEAAAQSLTEARMAVFAAKNESSVASERLESAKRRETELRARRVLLQQGSEKAAELVAQRNTEINMLDAQIAESDRMIAECDLRLEKIYASREEKDKELTEMRRKQKEAVAAKDMAFRNTTETEMKFNSVNTEYDGISSKLWDEYELTYSDGQRFRLPKESMEKAPSRLASLKAKIRSMGSINVNAVEEYRTTKERYDFLKTQTDDLNKARNELDSTISKLAAGMKETFLTVFDRINTEFDLVFRELFGGGSARVELTDPMMPLECGIDIVLKVPGKSVRSISLLSGGEQSFAAISLYLALQRVNPAPFCIFDEIESALDDVNLVKLASYVRRNSDKTQYILITHRRGTMERADTLYGITMRQKGISDFMRLNMAKLDENIKEYTQ